MSLRASCSLDILVPKGRYFSTRSWQVLGDPQFFGPAAVYVHHCTIYLVLLCMLVTVLLCVFSY
jgi:hypothetical protein